MSDKSSPFLPHPHYYLLYKECFVLGINKPYGLAKYKPKDSEFCLEDCLPDLAERLEIGNTCAFQNVLCNLYLCSGRYLYPSVCYIEVQGSKYFGCAFMIPTHIIS